MKQAGTITEDEYQAIIEAADLTYRDTVDKANKQYDEIYTATTTKLGKTGKYIDKETGNVKSNWQIFTENISKKWNDTWDSISKKSVKLVRL